jgi:hypothetical protein
MVHPIDRGVVAGFNGAQPSADKLPKDVREEIETRLLPDYLASLQGTMPSDVVEHFRGMSGEYGVTKRDVSEKPFFISDQDANINGARGNSFMLVKPGKKDAPFRIIFAHTDSPCLKVIQPFAQASAEIEDYSPCVYLSVREKGGIRPSDWYGQNVIIDGFVYTDGGRRRVTVPGTIETKAIHVEEEGDVRTKRDIKVATPYRKTRDLYHALGIRDTQDFGLTDINIFPVYQGRDGKNGWIVGNMVSGAFQDDRVCLWGSVKAALETIVAGTDNTVIVAGLDREEVGGKGTSSGFRCFVEEVIKQTVVRVYGRNHGFDLPTDLGRGKLLGDLPAICADVEIAFGNLELEENRVDLTDYRTSAVRGYGAYILASDFNWDGSEISPVHVQRMMRLLEKKLPFPSRRTRFQTSNGVNSADSYYGAATMADSLGSHMPFLVMGVPLVGAHNNTAENILFTDAVCFKEAMKVYARAP